MMKNHSFTMAAGLLATCFMMASTDTSFAGTWQPVGSNWTYLDDAGKMVTGQMIVDHNQSYYIGQDGLMKTGFVPINNAYYYFSPSGNMLTGWVFDQNDWYYMQLDAAHFGQMTINATQVINGKTYYFGADGKMVHDTSIGQTTYGSDGAAITNAQVATNTSNSAAATTTTTSTSGTTADHDKRVNDLFNLVNSERAKNGLSALTLNSQLCTIADERASELDKAGNLSIEGFEKYDTQILSLFTTYGLNLSSGVNDANSVMDNWMSSSTNSNTVLGSRFTNVGIGIGICNSTVILIVAG